MSINFSAITIPDDRSSGIVGPTTGEVSIFCNNVEVIECKETSVVVKVPITFSGGSITGQILADGTLGIATPSYSFGNDPDTGISRSAANTLDISVGGTATVQSSLSGNGYLLVAYNATANKQIVLNRSDNTNGAGVYVDSSNNFLVRCTSGGARLVLTSNYGVSTGGVLVQNGSATLNSNQAFTINGSDDTNYRSCLNFRTATVSSGVSSRGQLELSNTNTDAAPAYTFISDTDTGLYRVGADNIGLSTGGTLRFDVSTTAATSTLPLRLPNGSAATPSYSFTAATTSGMTYDTGNTAVDLVHSGAVISDFDNSAINNYVLLRQASLTVSAASYDMTNSPSVNVYEYTGAGASTWTAPFAVNAVGAHILINNNGGGNITLNRRGSDTFGVAAALSITISTGNSVILYSRGAADWRYTVLT